MGLLSKLFWLAIFIGFTFSFIILFEYGAKDYIKDYPKNAQSEIARFQAYTAPAKVKSVDVVK